MAVLPNFGTATPAYSARAPSGLSPVVATSPTCDRAALAVNFASFGKTCRVCSLGVVSPTALPGCAWVAREH